MNPQAMLDRVARAAQVREGPEGVRAILRAIAERGTGTTREIATLARLPLPVVAAVRGELTKEGIVARTPTGVALTEVGNAIAGTMFGPTPGPVAAESAQPPAIADDSFAETLARIVAARPEADVALDQAKATPETLARRVAYLDTNDAIASRRILLIGDDDFLSAALVAWIARPERMERIASPRRVAVAEIDRRILDALAAVLPAGEVGIETIDYDARDPFPEKLRGAFDVVITDPPYTVTGAELFLSRAIEAVGGRPGARCFLSFGHVDPATMRLIQAALAEMGWVVVEWTSGFNRYEGGTVLAGISLMAVLVLAPDAVPVVTGRYDGPLYTGDMRPMVRLYRCRQCGSSWKVGPAMRWSTVAALKRARCPDCGGDRFLRVGQRSATSET